MTGFVARKLLGMIATLLIAAAIIFVLLDLAPGDTARFILGVNATDEAVAVLRNHIQAGQKNVMADLRQRQAMRGRRIPSNSQNKKHSRKEKSWQQI